MKVEGQLFALLSVFFVFDSGIYWVLSHDVTGFTCILLTGGLTFIIGYYLLFTASRLDSRPEDRPDAEISEAAGEVGFFAPHSWWPIATAASFTLTTLGLIFGIFVILIGVAALCVTISGMYFEFYVGVNRTQGQTLSTVAAIGDLPTQERKFLGEG